MINRVSLLFLDLFIQNPKIIPDVDEEEDDNTENYQYRNSRPDQERKRVLHEVTDRNRQTEYNNCRNETPYLEYI